MYTTLYVIIISMLSLSVIFLDVYNFKADRTTCSSGIMARGVNGDHDIVLGIKQLCLYYCYN